MRKRTKPTKRLNHTVYVTQPPGSSNHRQPPSDISHPQYQLIHATAQFQPAVATPAYIPLQYPVFPGKGANKNFKFIATPENTFHVRNLPPTPSRNNLIVPPMALAPDTQYVIKVTSAAPGHNMVSVVTLQDHQYQAKLVSPTKILLSKIY